MSDLHIHLTQVHTTCSMGGVNAVYPHTVLELDRQFPTEEGVAALLRTFMLGVVS